MAGQFKWSPAKVPFTIKKGEDNKQAEDLEITPKRPFAVWRAREKSITGLFGSPVPGSEPAEPHCSQAVEKGIARGGPEAVKLARFFFANRTTPPEGIQVFDNGTFWSNAVRKDPAFQTNHTQLMKAIQDALQWMANRADQSPTLLDPNRLADPTEVEPLRDFATNLSFSFTNSPTRLAGDPLAYGIGDIQGIEIRITSFSGNEDGSFSLNLSYDIWDHFGSDDSDLYDPAQACLWLLQRKLVKNQDKGAFMPFRVKIVVKDVAGSGKVDTPKELVGYDWRGRAYPNY